MEQRTGRHRRGGRISTVGSSQLRPSADRFGQTDIGKLEHIADIDQMAKDMHCAEGLRETWPPSGRISAAICRCSKIASEAQRIIAVGKVQPAIDQSARRLYRLNPCQ